MGGIFLKITPMPVRCLLGFLGLSGLIADSSWTHTTLNSIFMVVFATSHPAPMPTHILSHLHSH